MQKVQAIIALSCLSSTKPCLRFILNCFFLEIKGFYQSSIGNEVDFRGIRNVSPNILAKSKNFKKLSHDFVDERALITTTLISFCHQKTLILPFCLRKKSKIFNTNSELLQNHTEKQIMLFKTTLNWLFTSLNTKVAIIQKPVN